LIRRRLGSAAAAIVVVVPVALGLTTCGAGNGQLQVFISSNDPTPAGFTYKLGSVPSYSQYKPGDAATFTIEVVNTGPGSVSGVTIHLVLPVGFRYRSTESISAPGSARTQPLDAAVNSGSPIFGVWTLSPPGTDAPGKNSSVSITVIAEAEGKPGPVLVHAFAAGDATAGQTDSAPYGVAMIPAAHLSSLVGVNPTTAKRGSTVTYEVRLTNDGTGNAEDVAILITLPPVLTFASSVTPFAGNGARNKGVDPIRNTLEVYYDGFLLPPLSNPGPGFVVIVFKATIVSTAPPGTYPVDADVTDVAGDSFTLHAVAPLTIT
jgi:uncharacterized repeat protein (TIGR01451 family)